MWFQGAHKDVGGGFEWHGLSVRFRTDEAAILLITFLSDFFSPDLHHRTSPLHG